MSFHPLRDFIVVAKPVEAEKTESGLLFKPSTAEQSKITKAKVLEVGSGSLTSAGTTVPLEVKAGDTIFFNRNYAVELSDGADAVLVLREEHVLAIAR